MPRRGKLCDGESSKKKDSAIHKALWFLDLRNEFTGLRGFIA